MITQEQLELIWEASKGNMDLACKLLEALLTEVPPEDHWDERQRCRPLLAAMRDA